MFPYICACIVAVFFNLLPKLFLNIFAFIVTAIFLNIGPKIFPYMFVSIVAAFLPYQSVTSTVYI